jgi:alanyl-tRNA synthetase
MRKLTSQQIRETRLNFFRERGHIIEPGASLIPVNDPTLLWINAGVAALKKYFDGSAIPESKRITNVQKCIRTNDIENVGKTARHHTFFEMLGNFSIGDYFRKEVIPRAYEILTDDKYFGMDKNKLYVTYHPSDIEARDLRIKSGIASDHLVPLEGNFRQIGEGPCGPNTEVFYDRGERWDPIGLGKRLIEGDIENDRYIEIWGIVFSQFNAVNGVKREDYKELPHKNIDTGAGLERIACILQGTDTNFETDLFMPIIKKVESIAKEPYSGSYLMPYRVISDHIRACVFALADGESFSNEGRGYVLRRLLRRAMRYGQKIGLHGPFMYELVPTVVDVMKCFYPYLIAKSAEISKMIKIEEEKFLKTLESGEAKLDEYLADGKMLTAADAFKLYDTYGFPIELTQEIAADRGIAIDMAGFEELLNKQKEMARAARKNVDSFAIQSKDLLDFKEASRFDYDAFETDSKTIELFVDGAKVDSIDSEGEVIFDLTPFYAEMGGQVADRGYIENGSTKAEVIDVREAPNKQHLHLVKVIYGAIRKGDSFHLAIDAPRRRAIMKNHSATHLLQAALIESFGNSIHQKGSYVDENYLRFDFSYEGKIKEEDLGQIEKKVNEYIASATPRVTKIMPLKEVQKLGAIAEFGDKYGSEVRVVRFGDISTELCGGTHVANTSDIGVFEIVSEGAIASGVRRIEAKSGFGAYLDFHEQKGVLNAVEDTLKASSLIEVEKKVNELLATNATLNKDKAALEAKLARYEAEGLLKKVEKKDGKNILVAHLNTNRVGLMKEYDAIKVKLSDYIILLVGDEDDKYPAILAVAPTLVAKGVKSAVLFKSAVALLGGAGGGRPELSQGSFVDLSKLDEVKKLF